MGLGCQWIKSLAAANSSAIKEFWVRSGWALDRFQGVLDKRMRFKAP